MSPEDDDGPWDPATEHDDSLAHAHDSDAMPGDDPPTTRASLADRVRVRVAARKAAADAATAAGAAPGRTIASTLPPPSTPARLPAQPTGPAASAASNATPATAAGASASIASARDDEEVRRTQPISSRGAAAQLPAGRVSVASSPSAAAIPASSTQTTPAADGVIVLDKVTRTPAGGVQIAAPRVDAGPTSYVIVATGSDAEHARKVCHANGLLVPVLGSLGAVSDAASIIVIGEPDLPVPDRVAYIARPTLDDTAFLQLLRSLISGRVVADPPVADPDADPRAVELAKQIAMAPDRSTIAKLGADAITTLTGADRAQLLFMESTDRGAAAGIIGWCTQTGHAVHASPAGEDARYLLELDDPQGKPQSRLLVQPVIGADRRVHAVLVAARRWRQNDFTPAERTALSSFAARIASGIDVGGPPATLPGTGDARKPRPTLSGVSPKRPGSDPATQSALVSTPRPASDSRPPPVTARRVDSRSPASSDPGLASTEPAMQRASESNPGVAATQPAMTAAARRPPSEPVRTRAPSESERPRSPSDAPRAKRRSADGSEPIDVAVVATSEDDIARVRRIARKTRLEVSVLARADEVPPYYRVVTLGEAWTPSTDTRVAYAARATITDDQLLELLNGLASDRAPVALSTEPPQTAAEAKRLQLAFASARKLAAATDLAQAETLAIAAVTALVEADRAYCVFYASDTGALWSEARRRARGDDRKAIAGVVGWAARTGRGVNVPRASADPRWLGPLDDADGDPNSQLLVQPVLGTDRRVIAVLTAVRRPKRPPFAEPDVSVIERYAALAGPLLQQLQLAAATQSLLRDAGAGDDDAADRRAVESPIEMLLRHARGAPRWAYAVGGAALMLLLTRLVGC